ncbi:kinase-like protein [Hypoxylon cercidicola]|nr:kinase-like protein [Hypoxylon cercidicola]
MDKSMENPTDKSISKPINDKFWSRALTLWAVKILSHRYISRFWWKHGVLFLSKFCIKTSPFGSLVEAHTMQFIAQHTSIPVPKVFCAFVHKGRSYIVMERISGESAAFGWVRRPEESKRKILAQLKDLGQDLRNVSPPEGTGVANILGGPVFDARLPGKSFWGPFATQEDFHQELRNGISLDVGLDVNADLRSHPGLIDVFTFHKQQFPPPALTHGDLSSFNILVRGDDVVSIVDWETAGWYPSYWEYICAWNVNPYNPFWQDEVNKFMEPMCHELEMDGLRRRYFG